MGCSCVGSEVAAAAAVVVVLVIVVLLLGGCLIYQDSHGGSTRTAESQKDVWKGEKNWRTTGNQIQNQEGVTDVKGRNNMRLLVSARGTFLSLSRVSMLVLGQAPLAIVAVLAPRNRRWSGLFGLPVW